jgi:hypothetical protein
MSRGLATALHLLWQTLREIFDEAPYARFLEREGLRNSSSTYAIFRRENEALKLRRPRCC